MDTAARTYHSPASIGLAILALATLLGPTPDGSPSEADPFTVVGSVSEVTHTSAERAVAIYEGAGIDLPHFYLREGCSPDDPSVGAGSNPKAWYSSTAHAGSPTVTVCHPACLRVMLHELAHHWDLTVLGQDHREDVMDLLAVDGWLTDDLPYRDRGGERWADIVAWGLMPCDILGKKASWGGTASMYGMSRTELGEVFTESTGIPPLHGYQFDPESVCG